jgi:hypothetical protein
MFPQLPSSPSEILLDMKSFIAAQIQLLSYNVDLDERHLLNVLHKQFTSHTEGLSIVRYRSDHEYYLLWIGHIEILK